MVSEEDENNVFIIFFWQTSQNIDGLIQTKKSQGF